MFVEFSGSDGGMVLGRDGICESFVILELFLPYCVCVTRLGDKGESNGWALAARSCLKRPQT